MTPFMWNVQIGISIEIASKLMIVQGWRWVKVKDKDIKKKNDDLLFEVLLI